MAHGNQSDNRSVLPGAAPNQQESVRHNAKPFTPPGYETRIEALMDVVRFGPACLPGATFLALLFHVERSLPYGKAADTASLSQMTGGIRRSDGSWVRAGSGLKKSTAAQANADLERRGLLARKTRESNRGGHQPTEYTVQWKALKAFFANVCSGLDTPLVHSMDKPLSIQRTSPLSIKWTHRVIKSSSQSKEKQSKGVQPSVKLGDVVESPAENPKPKNQNPLSIRVDDEKPLTPKPSGLTPEQEFVWRLGQRHESSTLDFNQVLADVKQELADSDVQFSEFLEADAKATTNPSKLHNPHGHYRRVARKLVNARGAITLCNLLERSHRIAEARQELEAEALKPRKRCEKCGGGGYLSLEPRQYCECDMGREVEAVERASAAREAKKALQAAGVPIKREEGTAMMQAMVAAVQ